MINNILKFYYNLLIVYIKYIFILYIIIIYIYILIYNY